MAIEQRAAEIAAEVLAEIKWLTPYFSLTPTQYLSYDPTPYAIAMAKREADMDARLEAAPESLRKRLAEIDAMPLAPLFSAEDNRRETERARIIKQIYGV